MEANGNKAVKILLITGTVPVIINYPCNNRITFNSKLGQNSID